MKCACAILFAAAVHAVGSASWAAAPVGQYADLRNGTVRDNRTGLVWQQQVDAKKYSWSDAKSYCGQLRLGAFASNWRLPTKLELESLVDPRATGEGATIDAVAFSGTPPSGFWTATSSVAYAGSAWYVNFIVGSSYYWATTETMWVRCVH